MITSNVVLKSQKGPSTIKRAKFGPGMLLQHEDLEQLNTYTRDLSRLLFRSFFGCGVVCGLEVSAQTDNCGKTSVTVEAGVALNCLGDPIYVPNPPVTFDATDGCDPNNPPLKTLYVWLCSCPKCCAPRTPSCGCDDGESKPACTREVDWYEIHLGTEKPECACGCEPKTSDNPPNAQQPAQNPTGATAPVGAAGPGQYIPANQDDPCRCIEPTAPCYEAHYAGECGCKCEDSNCVILAKLGYDETQNAWVPDYSVRRFIRPVLMRDPNGDRPFPPPPTASTAATTVAPKKAAAKKK